MPVVDDSVQLLKECDAGTKTAVNSMDEVMDKVKSPGLRELIMAHKRSHESLGNEIHSELVNLNAQEKDPNPAARAMTWMKTETQYLMKPEDRTIAGLMMDGCHMGIQKLSQYENQYTAASQESKKLTQRLIADEQQFMNDLRAYL